MSDRIIRTICLFKKDIDGSESERLQKLAEKLEFQGYVIQTKRVCSPAKFGELEQKIEDDSVMLSVGAVPSKEALENLDSFHTSRDNFNVELADQELSLEHTKVLFEIIRNAPQKTFNFTHVFNNAPSSPYMPSASYEQDGFAVGLQPTDLAKGANSLEKWLSKLEEVYRELVDIFDQEHDFLGIDSSIAPLFEGNSSLIHHINRWYPQGFSQSLTTDIYTRMSSFIKTKNPKVVGLSGIMLPCLEDFELAREYERGNFSIERNIFVSLHSGLGIDTYPIGVDERPERVLEILKLVQALSNKYQKPLSVRFVSDGKAKVGDKTDFQNQYLYEVEVNAL